MSALPHPSTDLRVVYAPDPAPALPEEVEWLSLARSVPEPRWLGVWSRPFGDALIRVLPSASAP